MTKPDAAKKIRDMLIGLAASCAVVSTATAALAHWNGTPFDVWLMLVAILALTGTVGTTISAAIAHSEYLSQLRSN